MSLGLTEKIVQKCAETVLNASEIRVSHTSFGRKWFSTIGTVYLLTMTIRVIMITIMIITMKIFISGSRVIMGWLKN